MYHLLKTFYIVSDCEKVNFIAFNNDFWKGNTRKHKSFDLFILCKKISLQTTTSIFYKIKTSITAEFFGVLIAYANDGRNFTVDVQKTRNLLICLTKHRKNSLSSSFGFLQWFKTPKRK